MFSTVYLRDIHVVWLSFDKILPMIQQKKKITQSVFKHPVYHYITQLSHQLNQVKYNWHTIFFDIHVPTCGIQVDNINALIRKKERKNKSWYNN